MIGRVEENLFVDRNSSEQNSSEQTGEQTANTKPSLSPSRIPRGVLFVRQQRRRQDQRVTAGRRAQSARSESDGGRGEEVLQSVASR